jgi:1,4-dihydroxy-2-naphthoate octaprenyltransferase
MANGSTPADVPPAGAVAAGSWQAWCIALRPKTFWIATIPVMVSSALVVCETGALDLTVSAFALLASLLLQAITNLQNDVGYTSRGAETGARIGLSRATANGWLAPGQVRLAIAVGVGSTLAVGAPLIARGGWPAALMGFASILAAVGYMGGPRPIAFTPLGELTVFVFFGLIAVLGSYYVQTGSVSTGALLAAVAVGALAAGVLAVNNQRDHAHDRATGRATFVVVFGPRMAQAMFRALLLLAYALVPALALHERSLWLLLPIVTVPAATRIWRDFVQLPPGAQWNDLLFRTVKLELAYGALLAAGALLATK